MSNEPIDLEEDLEEEEDEEEDPEEEEEDSTPDVGPSVPREARGPAGVPEEVLAAAAAPASILDEQITGDVERLITGVLKGIDPAYSDKTKNYRSAATEFIHSIKPALIGMTWKTFKNIVEVRTRGGFTEAEKVEAYKGLSIAQLNEIQQANVEAIAVWRDQRLKQLAVYQKSMEMLDKAGSNLLLKGLSALLLV